MNIAGVVLAGGESKRMGVDKSQLTIGNITLLDHAQQILFDSQINDVFVSGHHGIPDQYNNIGPIGGILSCLNVLKSFDFVLFIPVDMPFITTKMVNTLKCAIDNSAVHFKNYNMPLMIMNSPSIRDQINHNIKKNKLSLYQLYEVLDIYELKNNFQKELFMNTNTPTHWQDATNKLLEQ